ncbi:MAG TPA: hypothetical protein VM533_03915 [Fimbriiglobus sp.]|jgi:hypothetical protein|nr:hypothetical protein [Fimbriiglobus sp.]
MPRRPAEEPDDWDDDPDDLPDGVYHDEDVATVTCPHCRREVYEDAVWCPHCENMVSEGPPRRTWFWIVMMGLALAAAALWVL